MRTKFVKLREDTHQLVKVLAAQMGRRINGDLLDDLVCLGIEDMQKNFTPDVTCTGYKGASKITEKAVQA